MKKYKFFCIVLFIPLIQACSGGWVKVTPIDLNQISSKHKLKYSTNYKLNEIRTVYIGQEIIKFEKYTEEISSIQQVNVPENIFGDYAGKGKIEVDASVYQISKKILYDDKNSIGDCGQTFYLLEAKPNRDDWRWAFLVGEDGQIYEKALYSFLGSKVWIPPTLSVTPKTILSIHPLIKVIPGFNGDSFELIYTGKNNVSLNITYKEYTVDKLARPSFFQNLTYEANAKQIRFRDFVLQIHESTNEKLVYSVIEDGLK